MKVTKSVFEPAARTVPAAGVYRNVPGKLDEASNCESLSAVPKLTAEGVAHVIIGSALLTVCVTLVVAESMLPGADMSVAWPKRAKGRQQNANRSGAVPQCRKRRA